ncbi:MAG: PDZ domain-containing protein [Myxococcales bacterium]|nr:PDZ domain-containing protein [Myxococcales bacterium]
MRRTNLLSTSLVGLVALTLASVCLSEPSYAQGPKKELTVTMKGKRVTVVVTPSAEQGEDDPKALSDDDGKSKRKKDKADAKGDGEDKAEPKEDKADGEERQEDPAERARRGVVAIERAGEVVGMGTVLGKDGRILTALSPLLDGNNLAIRYSDGSTVKAKVGHSNRLWDMAMLVPQVGKWPEGLFASEKDPLQQKGLRSFSPGKGKAQVGTLVFKGRKSFLGADEQMIPGLLEIGTKLGAKDIGSPVIDDQGNVVAMVGRACLPVEKGPCLPSPVGIPVSVIRQFLSTAPPNAVRPAPWLGIRGVAEKGAVSGVRVLGVLPDSPADEAGLKGGNDKASSDLIVAVDDHPVSSPEELSKAILSKAVGERVKLLLFRQGKFQESTLVLQPVPSRSK